MHFSEIKYIKFQEVVLHKSRKTNVANTLPKMAVFFVKCFSDNNYLMC